MTNSYKIQDSKEHHTFIIHSKLIDIIDTTTYLKSISIFNFGFRN